MESRCGGKVVVMCGVRREFEAGSGEVFIDKAGMETLLLVAVISSKCDQAAV